MAVSTFQKKEYTIYAENDSGTIVAEYLANDDGGLSFKIELVQTTRVNGKNESKSFAVSMPGYLGPYRKPWKKFATEEISELAFSGLYDSQSTNGQVDRLVFNDLTFQQSVRRKDDGTMAFRRAHVHTKLLFNTALGKGGKSFPTNITLKPVYNASYTIVIDNAHDSVLCRDGVWRRPFVSPTGLRGFAQFFSLCLTKENLQKENVCFYVPHAADKVARDGFTHWAVWFNVGAVQSEAIRLCQLRTEISRAKLEADEISRLYAENGYDKNAPEYKGAWDAFNAIRDKKEEFVFTPQIVPVILKGKEFVDVDPSVRAGPGEATALLEVAQPSGKAPSTIFSRAAADASRATGLAPQSMADVG